MYTHIYIYIYICTYMCLCTYLEAEAVRVHGLLDAPDALQHHPHVVVRLRATAACRATVLEGAGPSKEHRYKTGKATQRIQVVPVSDGHWYDALQLHPHVVVRLHATGRLGVEVDCFRLGFGVWGRKFGVSGPPHVIVRLRATACRASVLEGPILLLLLYHSRA